MKRQCDSCGCVADEYWMVPYNVGRVRKWFCWDCYKNSQYEANKSDHERQKKLYQMHKAKLRNK